MNLKGMSAESILDTTRNKAYSYEGYTHNMCKILYACVLDLTQRIQTLEESISEANND